MRHILLVEDDRALSDGISLALRSSETDVTQCLDLAAAREGLAAGDYDLVVLDVNLPDGSGLDFLRELRGRSDLPVILLTANDLELDVVTGLELGADDYITKPFSLAVLRARINAQLRRARASSGSVTAIDGFVFDFEQIEFTRDGEKLELSRTEQKLLRLLLTNRGQTLTRAYLVDRIWTDGADYVDENALSVTVKRLRDKLEENPSKPRYVRTVYGVGYTWAVK